MFEKELSLELWSLLKKSRFAFHFVEEPVAPGVGPADRRAREKKSGQDLKKQILEELLNLGVPGDSRFTSTSHSSDRERISILVCGSERGIGVDLEKKNRPVAPAVLDRITSARERRFNLDALEFWVAKEASFKANPLNKETLLPNYEIVEWDRSYRTGRVESPGAAIAFRLVVLGEWLLALACVENQP
jgi:hypothetical protein